jgi:Uma2 family endonuclease
MVANEQQKLHTIDDLWELSHRSKGKRRYELVEGVIVEMAPAGGKHGGIALKLGALILQHVESHDLGHVTAAETGFVLFAEPYTVRGADVGFISKERLTELPEKYIPFAPDLAVEVVSPNDSASEIQAKVLEYLQAGTKLVWIVYPKTKTVVVHIASGAQTVLSEGVLDGGGVLPGLKLKVRDIFPK